jgi:putative FmdB family regulatory protein
MPIYEYRCKSCEHEFEVWQKMSDPPVKVCPKCHARKVEKLISVTSFQLKGTGWYATDYGGAKSSPPPEKSTSGDSASASASGSGDKGSGDKGSGDKGSGDKGSGDKGGGDKGSGGDKGGGGDTSSGGNKANGEKASSRASSSHTGAGSPRLAATAA